MKKNVTLDEVATKLSAAKTVLLFCHRRPDGDTLGSAFALRDGLVSLGKEALCVCSDRPSEKLSFLGVPLLPEEIPPTFTGYLPVAVDVASGDMLESARPLFRGEETIRLDHHLTGEDYAALYYVDEDAASTGEIVYSLLARLSALTPSAMEKVFAAVSSDTGCFRYRNTTSRTHRIAAELLDAGVDGGKINSLLNDSRTRKELLAEALAVSSMRFFCGGKVAVVPISLDQMLQNGLRSEDLDDVSSLPRTVLGVSVGVTLKQDMKRPGIFRLSVRTDGTFDAAAFCAGFGGGGHYCAAGGSVEARDVDEAVALVMEKLRYE